MQFLLCSNCTADQRLYFHYMGNTILLLLESKNFNLFFVSEVDAFMSNLFGNSQIQVFSYCSSYYVPLIMSTQWRFQNRPINYCYMVCKTSQVIKYLYNMERLNLSL